MDTSLLLKWNSCQIEPCDSKFTHCWLKNWSTFHHTDPKHFFTIFRAATYFLVLQKHITQAVNLVVSGPKSGDCLILYHNLIIPTAQEVVHGVNCSIPLIQEIFLLARISWTFMDPLISEYYYSRKILKEILNLSMAVNIMGLQCYHMRIDV